MSFVSVIKPKNMIILHPFRIYIFFLGFGAEFTECAMDMVRERRVNMSMNIRRAVESDMVSKRKYGGLNRRGKSEQVKSRDVISLDRMAKL